MAEQNIWNQFVVDMRAVPGARILELGTKRSVADRPTISRGLFPDAAEYIGTDFQPGLDVDVVADAHALSNSFAPAYFDAIVSLSTFEHLKYPFLAAHEILKCLKVGGKLFVQTHQTFQLHAYPSDYFRFSIEALSAMFPPQMGFRADQTLHEFPAEIHSVLGITKPAFLNSCISGTKTAPTPDAFVYDLPGIIAPADGIGDRLLRKFQDLRARLGLSAR